MARSHDVQAEGHALAYSLDWAKRIASHPPEALAGMKRMLSEAQEMHLNDAVMNDQRIFQEFSRNPPAIAKMEEVQAKFDAGASIRETYWPDELPE